MSQKFNTSSKRTTKRKIQLNKTEKSVKKPIKQYHKKRSDHSVEKVNSKSAIDDLGKRRTKKRNPSPIHRSNQKSRLKKESKVSSVHKRKQVVQLKKQNSEKRKKLNSNKKKISGKKRHSLKKMKKRVIELLAALVTTALIFLTVSSFFVKIANVSGYSMMPTLKDSDTVLVRKTKTIERFDLVLFQRGETQQIRRIIGLPGEQIKYSEDFLYVNGEVKDEKFLIDEINEAQKNGGQYTADFELYDISNEYIIPENSYMVLGDNREYGYDSRDYGLIQGQQIIGVVKMRLLPLNGLSAF